jgi:hypothetical protein
MPEEKKVEAVEVSAEPKKPAPKKGEGENVDVLAELSKLREQQAKLAGSVSFLKNANKALQEEVEALKGKPAPVEPTKPSEPVEEDQDIVQLSGRVERLGDVVASLIDTLDDMGKRLGGYQQMLVEEGSKIARSATEWYGKVYEQAEAARSELEKISAQLERKAAQPRSEARASRQAIDA